MTAVHAVVGTAVMATSLAAGLYGVWLWRRAEASPAFWTLLRVSQGVLVLQVILGFVLLATGHEPASLHVLYGLLPIGTTFVAEQLRVISAEHVLHKRGLGGTDEMRKLPDREQHSIVIEIVQRETGVMAASALVVFVLAARAAGVAGFF